jgi:repressor LexA
MMGITPRQRDLLLFIRRYVAENGGTYPNFREMADALGLKSKSNINYMLACLVERGHIRILPGKSRAIELVNQSNFVALNPEIHRLTERYAQAEGISVEVATNELLRASLGAVR